jgi:2-polyprenyl-3-methyl-5-hydroxy-6-metoxy-1,4-benzoquinol methylase
VNPLKVDIGPYNVDPDQYQKLIDELYANNASITLPPEYGSFVQDNLLRLLIRLARYKFVARLIKESDRVLEVGCGSGLGSIFLSQHCAHVTGLEVRTTEVEEARAINRRQNVEFVVGDLFELEDAQKYDVVVNLDVIEHMPIEQGRELVASMARHLEPAGMLVIGTPSIYSYQYQSPLSQASHVKCYDQAELLSVVDNYFGRTLAFSMNDEVVHTGFAKMAWYYFVLAFIPKLNQSSPEG